MEDANDASVTEGMRRGQGQHHDVTMFGIQIDHILHAPNIIGCVVDSHQVVAIEVIVPKHLDLVSSGLAYLELWPGSLWSN